MLTVNKEMDTKQLLLRTFRPEDWPDLQEYLSDPIVMTYMTPWPSSEEACKAICKDRARGKDYWAVCLKSCPEHLIGHVVFRLEGSPLMRTYELGYVFNRRYQGKGYAREAVERVVRYGFEDLNLHRITATCDVENQRSYRLMEKLGMRREGLLKQSVFLKLPEPGNPLLWRDEYLYALLQSEWMEQQAPNPTEA